MLWIFTHTWTKWLDISSQGLDPVHRDILFIAKVNVKDTGHLLVSSQSLDQASVPSLHIENKDKYKWHSHWTTVHTKTCVSWQIATEGLCSPDHRRTELRKPLQHRVHMSSLMGSCTFSEALCWCFAELPAYRGFGQEGKTCQGCRTLQQMPRHTQLQQRDIAFWYLTMLPRSVFTFEAKWVCCTCTSVPLMILVTCKSFK